MTIDTAIRHDREADLESFRNVPHHGYFINRDIESLQYTIMATGDDIVLENGETIEFLCLDEPKVYEFSKQKLRLQSVSETSCQAPKDEINVPY